jgi:dTDP-4-amino-4,6-dideoxygalactose transaminase
MIPRGRLDIRWRDILFGIWACLRPGNRARMQARVECDAFVGEHDLACLSVRTGFDALLTTLDYPAGSEVLVSALTIHDMVRIVLEHDLVPVPIDLDMDMLAVDEAALHRLVSERTTSLLVAHVFGADLPFDDIAAFARQRGLLLIEDRAQSYAGGRDEGHPAADVVLFSFGPIKTNTALGGAVLRFRDSGLRDRVRGVLSTYPVQSRRRFLKRLLKYAGLKALSNPSLFGAFARVAPHFGTTHDEVISRALRGFPGEKLLVQIRHQPSYPLLALLHRRLVTFDSRRIEQRRLVAERLAALLPGTRRPGQASRSHTHWVFPIRHADPDGLMRYLWARGFDATRGASSLGVVAPPREKPDAAASEAQAAMTEMVYLPVSAQMSPDQLERLATEVRAFDAATTHAGSRK